jgi:hypothetical protein
MPPKPRVLPRDYYVPAPTKTQTDDLYTLPDGSSVTKHNFGAWTTPDILARSEEQWLAVALIEELTGVPLP